MEHVFQIKGMSCNGCRNHIEVALSKVEGVVKATVNLEKTTATMEMDYHIPIETFQKKLKEEGNIYHIYPIDKQCSKKDRKEQKSKENWSGTFYCPMNCEGSKTYPKEGNCPVCGMDLIPKEVDDITEEAMHQKLLKKFWWAIIFTTPIFCIAMSEMIHNNPLYDIMPQKYWNWVQFGLSIPVVFYATWTFFERAYLSIKTWHLNMFTLVGMGAGVAWIFSVFGIVCSDILPSQFKTEFGAVHVYFEATTVILTLVLLGQLLEARGHSKTNAAVKELLKSFPNNAIKIIDGQEIEMSIDKIKRNDVLKLRPGDKIPVDGTLIKGNTIIDESMITGEPIPVIKSEGDSIRSGTINGNQSILIKAEKVGSDTLLSQIIDMVNSASRSRAPIQKMADTVSGYFVPIVVIISVLTFALWILFGPEPTYVYALVNAIAVLIIACPCALGLATPMSIMVGVGKGAQNGVLIKHAEALQRMDEVNTLIVDKTGTITEGKPTVDSIGSFDESYSEDEILQFIVSLNNNSEHPLGEATVKYGKEKSVDILNVDAFSAIVGKGVEGKVNGTKISLGNLKMMEYTNAKLTSKMDDEVKLYQKQGKTVSFLAIAGVVGGYVVMSDKIKETSAQAIKVLQAKGIDVIMLTGDHYNTAKTVASVLNIPTFKAGMLPEHKLHEVEKLQKNGKIVAVAGDGINDAPALAKSDVGIAMGTGTDIAIESAMITLVKGDLNGIIKAKVLSHAVMKNIKQNLFFALIYNTLGVPIAAGILFPFFGMLLSPMLAALAMSFSSISVIANALRLRSLRLLYR